jgi:hypothetical protein
LIAGLLLFFSVAARLQPVTTDPMPVTKLRMPPRSTRRLGPALVPPPLPPLSHPVLSCKLSR